jgi:D-alanyl-D-alanine carboxypeptidase/D-alanyl-D-alanine-endopeptidase (penicillin-binding protein 4)
MNNVPEKNFKKEIFDFLTTDTIFHRSHSGLVVENLSTGEEIINYKGDQYFTPASNTKLLTFYTSYKVLSDRMIGLKYYENEDSLIIWGTGDPSFFNPVFNHSDFIIPFLVNTSKPIYISFENFQDQYFGNGWAWNDYPYYYQCEKNALPIYGNIVEYEKSALGDFPDLTPSFFNSSLIQSENDQYYIRRKEDSNIIEFESNYWKERDEIKGYFPFKTDNETIVGLLEEKTGKDITIIESNTHLNESTDFYTISNLELYKQLLQPSDNFVAEQLLLSCGSLLFDTMNVNKVINWAKENLLADLPHEFQWADGSGLSRYNLTTPENTVALLKKIHEIIPEDILFDLLPTGGRSGTIRNLYAADPPFVHAKTGSLRNNHALSGYFIADSGQVYVFSFLNSNFYGSNIPIKEGMDKVLRILKTNL